MTGSGSAAVLRVDSSRSWGSANSLAGMAVAVLRGGVRGGVGSWRPTAVLALDFMVIRPQQLRAAVKQMYLADELMTELAEAAVNEDAASE